MQSVRKTSWRGCEKSAGGGSSFRHRRFGSPIQRTRSAGSGGHYGRYLERESAAGGEIGFDGHNTGVEISARLQCWQAQKDELLWKLIISPEFGDRVDLQRLTRDPMNRLGRM
jgi:hypothetical protein